MAKVKLLDSPKYYHCTEDGHDYYVRSYSDFKGPGRIGWWCDEHKDFHHGQGVDPATIPREILDQFAATPPAHTVSRPSPNEGE